MTGVHGHLPAISERASKRDARARWHVLLAQRLDVTGERAGTAVRQQRTDIGIARLRDDSADVRATVVDRGAVFAVVITRHARGTAQRDEHETDCSHGFEQSTARASQWPLHMSYSRAGTAP